MRYEGGRLVFAATDLSSHLACAHLTGLRRAVALGEIERPTPYDDPRADVLRRRGIEHEQRLLERFAAEGRSVETVTADDVPSAQRDRARAAARTVDAMRRGVGVIYQGRLEGADGRWSGYPDFLLRVERPSGLGGWSYEVVDAKLAREAKGAALLQLLLYSDLLQGVQGTEPEWMHLALGGGRGPVDASFRVAEYAAYYRAVRRRFEAQAAAPPDTYPEPVEHCALCDWRRACADRRRVDDHLSLVAGITRGQRRRLVEWDVTTMADLAALDLPRVSAVDGISSTALAHIRDQARIQDQARRERRRIHELITPVEADRGLAALPAPSAGDVFFDIEGDAFAGDGGLEYLFGTVDRDGRYEARWAFDAEAERCTFEDFIDWLMARWARHPDFHIHHYAAYETTAVKRLMSRYATREEEVDRLLRGRVFVDLHRVVRQGLRASVESYSIKRLEPFYDFVRDVDLTAATRALVGFEARLESGAGAGAPAELRAQIQGYNRDDCLSTLRLAEWLEGCRRELRDLTGEAVPRPAPREDEREQEREGAAEVQALFDALTAGLPADDAGLDDDQRARRLLAYLLDFHRREDKSMWWEFFHRCGFSEEEFVADRATLGGLTPVGEVDQVKRSVVHRYRFPEQPHEIEVGKSPKNPATAESDEQRRGFCGEVVALDEVEKTIDLKRGRTAQVPHPRALVPLDSVNARVLRDSLLRLAAEVASGGFAADSPRRASFDLLRRIPPRVGAAPRPSTEPPPATGPNLVGDSETPLAAVLRIAPRLDRSVLPVQGPPGSGKTYAGARMILDLLARGQRVGVTANSHKVISNLLGEVCRAADQQPGGREPGGPSAGQPPVAVSGIQKIQKADAGDACRDERITRTDSNPAVAAALAAGDANLAAGTAWLWARPEMADAVDVLVIDEAGQMSLANTLAAAQAARSVVLLGDPRQLDQPIQGIHPPGADVSALGHLLGGSPTIEPSRGVFLDRTWRMHPAVCAFTTEQFYAGRLGARPELDRQRVIGPGPLAGSGLRFVAVEHAGNTNASDGGGRAGRRAAARAAGWRRNLGGSRWRPASADAGRRPGRGALQRAGRHLADGAPGRRACRHRGQVPGPGGAHRHLLDGDLHAGRGPARHGVPLQPEPSQRGHVPRALRGGHRRQPGAPDPGLPDAGADAPGEPVLPLPGAGGSDPDRRVILPDAPFLARCFPVKPAPRARSSAS